LLDKSKILTSTVSLVSGGSVGEPITDEPLASFQGGANHLGNVLSPVGCIEKQFGQWFHFAVDRIEKHFSYEFAQAGPTRFASNQVEDTALGQERGQKFHLGGFPTSLYAFETHEHGG
jgi:hypothetical protein